MACWVEKDSLGNGFLLNVCCFCDWDFYVVVVLGSDCNGLDWFSLEA